MKHLWTRLISSRSVAERAGTTLARPAAQPGLGTALVETDVIGVAEATLDMELEISLPLWWTRSTPIPRSPKLSPTRQWPCSDYPLDAWLIALRRT